MKTFDPQITQIFADYGEGPGIESRRALSHNLCKSADTSFLVLPGLSGDCLLTVVCSDGEPKVTDHASWVGIETAALASPKPTDGPLPGLERSPRMNAKRTLSESLIGEFEIGEELIVVNLGELLHGLEFEDDLTFHQDVGTESFGTYRRRGNEASPPFGCHCNRRHVSRLARPLPCGIPNQGSAPPSFLLASWRPSRAFALLPPQPQTSTVDYEWNDKEPQSAPQLSIQGTQLDRLPDMIRHERLHSCEIGDGSSHL